MGSTLSDVNFTTFEIKEAELPEHYPEIHLHNSSSPAHDHEPLAGDYYPQPAVYNLGDSNTLHVIVIFPLPNHLYVEGEGFVTLGDPSDDGYSYICTLYLQEREFAPHGKRLVMIHFSIPQSSITPPGQCRWQVSVVSKGSPVDAGGPGTVVMDANMLPSNGL